MKNKKSIIIALCVLLLLITAAVTLYLNARVDPHIGEKAITIVIITDETKSTSFLHTDAEYLRQVLEEYNLISGDESAFGLFVTSVNGIEANAANNEWWCFTKNSEVLQSGVDDTPIADGDSFEITLSTY